MHEKKEHIIRLSDETESKLEQLVILFNQDEEMQMDGSSDYDIDDVIRYLIVNGANDELKSYREQQKKEIKGAIL